MKGKSVLAHSGLGRFVAGSLLRSRFEAGDRGQIAYTGPIAVRGQALESDRSRVNAPVNTNIVVR